ncbi:MAG TPA: enoyl-CoA hydratase-related protein, partial [Burkholderiaceae bacterium]|nr:enoyl-CoA hydratase-related protein [Burkholderiaceae bacterium]
IGIPVPATYVELIKYALGDQLAALAILRGKLYELDEAERLGFFHEVVAPDQLLPTAISYACSITPDCNVAYAMSKRALQDSTLRQMEERMVHLDEKVPAGMCDEGNRRAQDRRRLEVMNKRKQ